MEMAEEKFYQQILEIINSENKFDVPPEIISQIEDTGFTVKQSEIISPWLLDFVIENRDTYHCEDGEAMVYPIYSAIRTGASMLFPDQVERLFPLLETGHTVDTSLVTVKLIGRIFEAQPPLVTGAYETTAEKVYDLVNPILDNSPADMLCRDTTIATLCIIALVAMGSEKVYQILEKIKNKKKWIRNRTLHKMKDLRKTWQKRAGSISLPMDEFINETINFFEKETKND